MSYININSRGTDFALIWLEDNKIRIKKMTVYKRNATQPLKWFVAILVFVLAMTITFDEVEGVNIPPSKSPSQTTQKSATQGTTQSDLLTSQGTDELIIPETPPTDPDPTSPVPEPGTLIIMAAGLSAMYMARSNTKTKS